MTDERPNILLIMTDQHRSDAMGCAGNPVVRTPYLDRLAAGSVRFERTYCQGPLCMPARASLLTGRYVRDHGCYVNNRDLPEELPNFVRQLRRAGYRTACTGKMHFTGNSSPRLGEGVRGRPQTEFMQALGFDEVIELVNAAAHRRCQTDYSDYLAERGLLPAFLEWAGRQHTGLGGRGADGRAPPATLPPAWHVEPAPIPADADVDSWLGRRIVRWIEEYDGSRPFFHWVGFPGPHPPWDAPVEVVDRYRAVDVPLGSRTRPDVPIDGPLSVFLAWRLRESDTDNLTDATIRDVQRAYYAKITLIDEQIGAIIAALERRGMLDNTWIIYTTDHGEMLGDHRLMGKMVFYEPAVRVPLIIRPPGGIAGRVADSLVEHVDVTATICEIASAPAIPGGHGRSLLGFSPSNHGRMDLVANTPHAALNREVAFSENFGLGMAVTDRYKLVFDEHNGEALQFFDLKLDACEDHNEVDNTVYLQVQHHMMARFVEPFLRVPPQRPVPNLLRQPEAWQARYG